MKFAKNMILLKGSSSAAFYVSRKKDFVKITYYNNLKLSNTEELSLDNGSKKYYILLDNGYKEAF
jgi:hypothetical protein